MRQAPRSRSAMLAKYTGWGTALGRPAGENEVKRTAAGRSLIERARSRSSIGSWLAFGTGSAIP